MILVPPPLGCNEAEMRYWCDVVSAEIQSMCLADRTHSTSGG